MGISERSSAKSTEYWREECMQKKENVNIVHGRGLSQVCVGGGGGQEETPCSVCKIEHRDSQIPAT